MLEGVLRLRSELKINAVFAMQLAVEYGDRVRFLKIDTDEEHELANQMEVRSPSSHFLVVATVQAFAVINK
jgi:hypothetical protein